MGVDILEGLSRVKTVFFDKTGTITSHSLALSGICTNGSGSQDELLRVAASMEFHSVHPLAISLVKEAERKGLEMFPVAHVSTRPGLGIEGEIESRRYSLGSRTWFEKTGTPVPPGLLKAGKGLNGRGSIVYLKEADTVKGFFVFRQALREGVSETLSRIKDMGIRTVILTGDDERGATEIQDRLEHAEIKWGLLPEDKVREIEKAKQDHVVAMVGDGINDAPALEAAHVGIAMGCGTELTRESAKINLLGDDLRLIPYLIQLSKKVRRKVYTNFFWAFAYNAAGIILAVNGTITPLFAVVAMLLSSLIVIGNSMRL